MSGDAALRFRIPRDPLEPHLASEHAIMRVLRNAHVLQSQVQLKGAAGD